MNCTLNIKNQSKKIIFKKVSYLLCITLILTIGLLFTSCAKYKPNKKYCDLVNQSVEEGNPKTYDEVLKDLKAPYGNSIAEYPNTESSKAKTGYCIWIDGYKTYEKAKAAQDKRKDVYVLVITFKNGNVQHAAYVSLDSTDITK